MYNNQGPYSPNGGYNPNGSYPPGGTPYGSYYPPAPPYPAYNPNPYPQIQAMKIREKKELKVFSRVAGGCVLGYLLAQELLSLVLASVPTLRDMYITSTGFQSAIGIIYSLVGVLLPFLVGAAYLINRTGKSALQFGKPSRVPDMLLLVPIGFLICLIANFVTNIFITQMENAGFDLAGGEFAAPNDWFGRIFYVIEIAIVPPLCEELAARGVVMMPLRKYGDRFAVFASAFVFAVMHGNLVQAPFAFLVGLAIGYAVCQTNSIWTGILIHFANNLFSVVMELILTEIPDEATQNIIYFSIICIAAAAGIICSVVFIMRKKGKGELILSHKTGHLTSGEKGTAYVFTAPMVIAVLALLAVTAQYVTYKGIY